MPISKSFKRIEDAVQLMDDAKFLWQPEQILQKSYVQMKKYGIYKDECKEWMKKNELEKTWENFKTLFIEAYFELKGDTELNIKLVGFVKMILHIIPMWRNHTCTTP